jgi:DNA-binding transcriptional ArsR family regulator
MSETARRAGVHAPDVFNAIAHPVRRAILDELRHGHRCAGDLVADSDISRPAVSQHLGVLRTAGLVTETRDGRSRRYRLVHHGLGPVRDWISEYDTMWAQRVDGFADDLDRAAAS